MPNFTNDEYMTYDLRHHRYVLTRESVARRYGIQLSDVLNSEGDIDPDTLPERFLDRASMMVYEYIKLWSSMADMKIYEISKAKYRDCIEDAMLELVYCWLATNTDPSLFWQQNYKELIKMNPTVHTILINGGCLFRGFYHMQDNNWLERKGEDW